MNHENNSSPALLIKPSQIQRMVEKRGLIDEFKRSGLSVNRFAREHSIGVVALWRDLKRAQKGVDGLIDRRTCRRPGGVQVENAPMSWILAYLAAFPKTTIQTAWQKLGPIAQERNWRKPSYDQLCRAIRQMPPDMRELLANGAKAHFEAWGVVTRKENAYPNQMWQLDATELDLWVLDTTTGELFRPWMTSIIDGCSRVILAARLHRLAPDTSETLLTLRDAILPKNDEGHPFYGLPERLQADNGSIYKSTDFLEALLRLNIEKVPIPNDCPSANGKIERWFGTFKLQLLRSLDGFAGQHAALARARKHSIPWPLLPKLVKDYLLKYHLAVHSALNMTPWEAWHQRLAEAKGLQLDPKAVCDAIQLRREVTVRRDGVEVVSRKFYHSPKLAGLVGETITVRIPPDGPGDTVEAYHQGEFLDLLRKADGNAALAQQIKEARLNRVIELQALRKTLKEIASTTVSKPVQEVSGGPAAPTVPGTPAPAADPAVSASNNDAPLNIPKLSTEEKP